MRKSRQVLCSALAVFSLSQAAPAERDDARSSGTLTPTVIQDLHYGEVLFHFFQDDYFGALIRLRAAQEKDRLLHHAEEAELLLGGLYLSDGQHLEAGRIFERLLAGRVAPAVRDRAWFYLGKVWYQRGYWPRAEQALRQAGGALSGELEAERRNLLAQVLIHQGRYEEAIADLRQAQGHADWIPYGRYNLGVALARAGRLNEAAEMLNAVGEIESGDAELLALRDKANVALGYAYLQAERPADAKGVLQRVRLQGPQSNKALLAFGWAASAEQRYEEALTPWMELRERDLLDAAVQESYLAIPYAFARLDAQAQAVEFYTAAIRSYAEESARIGESIKAIRSGRMLRAIVTSEQSAAEPQGWFWQLKNLPQAPESRYLHHLLAGHEFQEGLKNYRDLGFLQRNLSAWTGSIEAFGDMLEARRVAYESRLPKVNAALAKEDPDGLSALRTELQSRVNAVERNEDFAALGDADEQRMWAEIAVLERQAEPLDEHTRDKLRLLKGVLYWQLNGAFKARLWGTRRSLKDLDASLRELQRRWLRVELARDNSPKDITWFSERIDALRPRLDALEQSLAQGRLAQQSYLSDLAIAELQQQQQRLSDYQLQARYALATLYDRALDTEQAR